MEGGGLGTPAHDPRAEQLPLLRFLAGGVDGRAAGQSRDASGLGHVGQPSALVDRVADDGVLVASFGADVAGERLPVGNADPPTDVEAAGEPVREVAGGAERGARGVVDLDGRAEDGERGVALEFVDEARMLIDDVGDDAEEGIEQGGGVVRTTLLRQPRRSDDVDEQDADAGVGAVHADTVGDRELGHGVADVSREYLTHAVPFGETLDHPVETVLQHTEFRGVVHGHASLVVTVVHAVHRPAHLRQRIGDRLSHKRDDTGSGCEAHQAEDHGCPVDRAVDIGQQTGPAPRVDRQQTDHRYRRAHRPDGQHPHAHTVHDVVRGEVLEDDDGQGAGGAFGEQIGETGTRHTGQREGHGDARHGRGRELFGDEHVEQRRRAPGDDRDSELHDRYPLYGASTGMVGGLAADEPAQLGPDRQHPQQQIRQDADDDRTHDHGKIRRAQRLVEGELAAVEGELDEQEGLDADHGIAGDHGGHRGDGGVQGDLAAHGRADPGPSPGARNRRGAPQETRGASAQTCPRHTTTGPAWSSHRLLLPDGVPRSLPKGEPTIPLVEPPRGREAATRPSPAG